MYTRAAELDPREWRWRYYRALIQFERGGGESLADTLRGVVGQAPDFGPAWLRLGDALFKARQYDAARQAWERANQVRATESEQAAPGHVAEVPLSAYADVGLARIALVEGDIGRARQILERVAADAPHFRRASRETARCF